MGPRGRTGLVRLQRGGEEQSLPISGTSELQKWMSLPRTARRSRLRRRARAQAHGRRARQGLLTLEEFSSSDQHTVRVVGGIGALTCGFTAARARARLSGLPVVSVLVPKDLGHRQDPRSATLIPAVHDLGVNLCADGIETAEQEAWWREAGADLAIGAHYGSPRDAGGFLRKPG